MKKLCALFICLTLLLVGCGKSDYKDYVSELCGINISAAKVVSSQDSHGGFNGDGVLAVSFDCSDVSDAALDGMKAWPAFPLSDNIQHVVYGGFNDDVSIPEITNGCYLFRDRHSDAVDPTDDSKLFDRYSYNFTLLLFDFDTKMLYLIEVDT
ncbi:MAG TPA: hypothetical protein DIT84_09440 [Clostridiales bacterium]|nr:hypothetical protein [Clostridiales bacterium]